MSGWVLVVGYLLFVVVPGAIYYYVVPHNTYGGTKTYHVGRALLVDSTHDHRPGFLTMLFGADRRYREGLVNLGKLLIALIALFGGNYLIFGPS